MACIIGGIVGGLVGAGAGLAIVFIIVMTWALWKRVF